MDGKDFCGKWKLITGRPPESQEESYVRIKEDGEAFRISYSTGDKLSDFDQELYFDAETHTLSSRPDDGKPQRCVGMWKRPEGKKTYIFAMWIANGSDGARLPWETGDNGSWGAEGG